MNFLVANTSRNALRLSKSRIPVGVRCFSIREELARKEKVEEDRFVREQERKFFEKKRRELEAKLVAEHLKMYQTTIAPAMAEIEALLGKTGDRVNEETLEMLAKWKMGIKE